MNDFVVQSNEINGAIRLLNRLRNDFDLQLDVCRCRKKKLRKMADNAFVAALLGSKDNMRAYLYEEARFVLEAVKKGDEVAGYEVAKLIR